MSHCARCGAEFACGVADGPTQAPCWCMQVPPLPAGALADFKDVQRDALAERCLCRTCLMAALAAAAP